MCSTAVALALLDKGGEQRTDMYLTWFVVFVFFLVGKDVSVPGVQG